MGASVEISLKAIDRQIERLTKAVEQIAKSTRPKAEAQNEQLVQCICPNCNSMFVAELPEGQKIVIEED